LFFGWEGVGLMSYLLIGFWYYKPEANAAAIKAFIVNRVGDFGFSLGIFATFMMTGAIDFGPLFAQAPALTGKTIHFLAWDVDALTLICLLLFMGAMGKSAQFLLHTWLPDAMEGPTPVSALIHAATMVTAGVFLVARMSPFFELAPDARIMVLLVGSVTAFFAGTVGLVQNDIKRVIAFYSGRLMFMTFHGAPRANPEVMSYAHESPPIMLVPLYLLAAGALFAGILFAGSFIGEEEGLFWGTSLYRSADNNVLADMH